MATNRADTLDPALLRPGRLDRKIEFPVPDRRQKRLVFQVITSKMNLSDEVDLEDCSCFLQVIGLASNWLLFWIDVSRPDNINCATINAICQEAGMQAVRKNRYVILPKDFEKGYKANVKGDSDDFQFYSWIICRCVFLLSIKCWHVAPHNQSWRIFFFKFFKVSVRKKVLATKKKGSKRKGHLRWCCDGVAWDRYG